MRGLSADSLPIRALDWLILRWPGPVSNAVARLLRLRDWLRGQSYGRGLLWVWSG